MRLPHEQYIRFLITSGLGVEDVNDHLVELGLPPCPVTEDGVSEYYDEQYQILHDSQIPKQIKDYWEKEAKKVPKDFISYMNTLGLKEAWLYNAGKSAAFANAVDVVKDEDISLTTRALLALKSGPEEVSAIVNGKFAYPFSKEAVELFSRFFFNAKIMSRESWRNYLKLLNAQERLIFMKALSGREKEVRAELELPNKISVSEHYQQIHIYAMEKFNTYRRNSSAPDDANALKWAQLAMASGDKYEKLKLGDVNDFTRDIQLEFETIETDFGVIGQDVLEEVQKQKNASKREAVDKAQKENSDKVIASAVQQELPDA